MKAQKFIDKTGKSSFVSAKGTYSEAIQQISVSMDANGNINEDNLIFFIRHEKPETVQAMLKLVLANIESGKNKLYKVFSKMPFYENQKSDINPKTGEILGRFSKVLIGSVEVADNQHKSYVESVVAKTTTIPVTSPEVTKEDVFA